MHTNCMKQLTITRAFWWKADIYMDTVTPISMLTVLHRSWILDKSVTIHSDCIGYAFNLLFHLIWNCYRFVWITQTWNSRLFRAAQQHDVSLLTQHFKLRIAVWFIIFNLSQDFFQWNQPYRNFETETVVLRDFDARLMQHHKCADLNSFATLQNFLKPSL